MGVQLNIPQQQHIPLTPGANSPQQSAAMKIDNMNKTQSAINKIGGRYKIYKTFGGANIEIPPTSTASYNSNNIVKGAVTNSLNTQANSEFDKGAFKAGSKRHRKIHKTKRRNSKSKKRRHRTRRYSR
jgi:hypothetical protein